MTLPAEARDIGGLGIYMAKRAMDEVSYARGRAKPPHLSQEILI